MAARPVTVSLLSLLALAAACRSSAPYAGPGYTAAAVAVPVAGAVANRAMGGCLAMCTAGTHCNRATGLCESGHTPPVATTRRKRHAESATLVSRDTSYEPGHEYEVPPLGGADAGCDPASHEAADGGALACEMDGGAI